MTKFQQRRLRKIAKRAVTQGDHRRRIVEFYEELVKAARVEFYNDSKPTLDDFLRECHEEALNRA